MIVETNGEKSVCKEGPTGDSVGEKLGEKCPTLMLIW